MNNLLKQLSSEGTLTVDLYSFVFCILISILVAWITSLMYLFFYENRATGSQIHRAFALISPSVTMLFICVQLSLPLSLGLLGSLSIIRFRTPIKEPEEIGFLLLLIASSIGIATFNFMFVLVLYIAVFISLVIKKMIGKKTVFGSPKGGVILVNLPESEYDEKGTILDNHLKENFKGLRMESVVSTEGTISLQYVFANVSQKSWSEVQREIKSKIDFSKLNIYLTNPANIP
ncbi:MAG: DUF4956 domain-containing protein [Kiritimatiellae bacterium]|jgi:hypothetical protein|nr:DUF4956 domain-containing protein [Kiritimatiellia bacterium]